MTTKNIAFLLFAGVILFASVSQAIAAPTIPEASSNPFCSAPGKFKIQSSAIESANEIAYDHYSYFYDQVTYDSVELFLKDPVGGNGFIFTSFDDQFSTSVTLECQGTATYTFVAIRTNLLVMQNPGDSNYYMCLFDPTATGPLPTAQLAASFITTPTTFVPTYYDHLSHTLMVLISSATESAVFQYSSQGPFVTGTTTVPANLVGPGTITFDHPLEKVNGNGFFIYDNVLQIFKGNIGGTWSDKSSDFPVGATDVVKTVPLVDYFVGFMVLQTDMMAGKLYLTDRPFTVIESFTLPTSSIPYESRTDYLINYVVIGQNFLYWANIDFGLWQFRSVKLTTEIDTDTMLDLTLSGNKLVVVYDDRAEYYQMTGSGIQGVAGTTTALEHLFTKTLSSWSADGQYKINLSCLCAGLNRFACYSSTLNCLIIKTAGTACGTKDIPVVLTEA